MDRAKGRERDEEKEIFNTTRRRIKRDIRIVPD